MSLIIFDTKLLQKVICVLCGFVCGLSLHRGTVTDPSVIQKQMSFREFTLIKFFLSALSTSMFAMSLMAMIPQTTKLFNIATNHYFNKIAKDTLGSSIIGGILMGSGMTLAGSCPVSMFVQLGAMAPNSGHVLIGALSAILLYYLVKTSLDILFRSSITQSKNPWSHSPYFMLSLPIVAMFGILVCAFETLIPFEVDSSLPSSKHKTHSLIFWYPWPPYISGAIVGLLQIPLILTVQKTLGGSSGLMVLVSQLRIGSLKRLPSTTSKYRSGIDNWWEVMYIGGIMLGGWLSAHQSESMGEGLKTGSASSILGGFLMTFGTMLGGGCTFNHGLTGMGLLSIQSFIMIICTFASATVVAFVSELVVRM